MRRGDTVTWRLKDALPQPAIAVTVMSLAAAVVVRSWLTPATVLTGRQSPLEWGIAAGLAVSLVLTQQFPIHVRHNSKINVATVPLYLMAVLLPLPLAVLSALAGLTYGELSLKSERGGYYSDIATQAGRWTLVVAAGALTNHALAALAVTPALPLVVTAVVLWLGDMLSTPLVIGPITREAPPVVVAGMVREAGGLEAGQYLIGILGAIAAQQVIWSLLLLALPIGMIHATGKRAKELRDNTREILESMADTVDLRDPYTGGHSRRVTAYTRDILRELGVRGPDADLVVAAARVHDIGKIGMPDGVLLKEDSLTDEEWAIMKAHPERGADILTKYPDFARGVEIVRHHHERWDGGGYPHRLREQAIPFGARVIAVADSFDAMTSDRPYRRGMPVPKAAAILREGRGAQWEGRIVDAFLRTIDDRLAESGRPVLHLVPQPAELTESIASA
jgi:hypothetical protein